MFWNKKTNNQKILKAYEDYFHLEKDSLSKTHMPTEGLVELVVNPAKRIKKEIESALNILGLSISKDNVQKLEEFFKTQI